MFHRINLASPRRRKLAYSLESQHGDTKKAGYNSIKNLAFGSWTFITFSLQL